MYVFTTANKRILFSFCLVLSVCFVPSWGLLLFWCNLLTCCYLVNCKISLISLTWKDILNRKGKGKKKSQERGWGWVGTRWIRDCTSRCHHQNHSLSRWATSWAVLLKRVGVAKVSWHDFWCEMGAEANLNIGPFTSRAHVTVWSVGYHWAMGQTIIFFSISETWSFQPWLCDETAVRVSKKVDLNVLSTAQGHIRTTTVHVSKIITCIHLYFHSRSGVLRTQQLRSHLLRTQSWQMFAF